MKEIWIDIKNYEGLYQVSNTGFIKSLNYRNTGREKILKFKKLNCGHLRVALFKNGKRKEHQVHRIVAEHFLPNPENKPIVHHIDHNPQNNMVNNLMWVTEQQHKELHPEIVEMCSKSINQYDLDNNFIRTWQSSMEIEMELGYDQGNIIKCCQGKYKTAYDYIWKYK